MVGVLMSYIFIPCQRENAPVLNRLPSTCLLNITAYGMYYGMYLSMLQTIHRSYLKPGVQIFTPETISIPGDHGDRVAAPFIPLNLFFNCSHQ